MAWAKSMPVIRFSHKICDWNATCAMSTDCRCRWLVHLILPTDTYVLKKTYVSVDYYWRLVLPHAQNQLACITVFWPWTKSFSSGRCLALALWKHFDPGWFYLKIRISVAFVGGVVSHYAVLPIRDWSMPEVITFLPPGGQGVRDLEFAKFMDPYYRIMLVRLVFFYVAMRQRCSWDHTWQTLLSPNPQIFVMPKYALAPGIFAVVSQTPFLSLAMVQALFIHQWVAVYKAASQHFPFDCDIQNASPL